MTDAHTPTEPVVFDDSPEAATYRTDIKGWVGRDGRFYGDGPSGERTARYAGSTHSKCQKCQATTRRGYTLCDGCRDLADHERWLQLELVEWDGETPLVAYRGDDYFFDAESVYDHADTHELKVSELDLVVCRPNLARQVDSDYWSDELPEDGELPDWLEDAVKALNDVIAAHEDDPLSWGQGKQRVILPDAQAGTT
jgi:hypothetical protein